MKHLFCLIIFSPFFLTSCTITNQRTADNTAVLESSVDPDVYDKVVSGQPLSVQDVKALAHAGVSDDITIRCMQTQKTVYRLNAHDVENLVNAGVSSRVANFMLATPTLYSTYHAPGYDMTLESESGWYAPWNYSGSYGYR